MSTLDTFSKMFVLAGITIFFGFIYTVYNRMNPNAFGFPKDKKNKSVLDPFYFSFSTMSTVGYGDFSPKDNVAKVLVMAQQAVILFEIVSLFGAKESMAIVSASANAASNV
jgi:voltage-gated potassium channel